MFVSAGDVNLVLLSAIDDLFFKRMPAGWISITEYNRSKGKTCQLLD